MQSGRLSNLLRLLILGCLALLAAWVIATNHQPTKDKKSLDAASALQQPKNAPLPEPTDLPTLPPDSVRTVVPTPTVRVWPTPVLISNPAISVMDLTTDA